METTTRPSIARMLPRLGVLVALVAFAHLVLVLRDNQIDPVSTLALLPAAAWYLYTWLVPAGLREVRFGRLVAHAAAYLVVNVSYLLHALILVASDLYETQGRIVLPEGWFGVVLAMPVGWGIGLLGHTISSIAQRGYEELPA